jgi:predicted phage tail protein
MLVPIILSGFLARQFGKRFDLSVASPREAIRALCIQLPGFEKAVLTHSQGFKVWVDREQLLDAESLDRRTGVNPIRIVPVISGAKSGGVGIILGAALLIAAPYMAPYLAGMGMGAGAAATVTTMATSLGMSLILGGIAQMLASPPKPTSAASNVSNLLFSGAVNTTAQGNAIPICYGEMLVGSQVISAGIEAVQMPYSGYAAGDTSIYLPSAAH